MSYFNLILTFLFITVAVADNITTLLNTCGVDLSTDCSSFDSQGATIIFYFSDTSTVYTLDEAGALALTSNTDFSSTLTTLIFQHGYTKSPDAPGPVAIKDAVLQLANVNYLAINASQALAGSLISLSDYKSASTNTVCLGKLLAEFLSYLVANGVSENLIYLVGHSLGALIVSYAGRDFTATTSTQVHRITTLDSAGPCFYPDADIQPKSTDAINTDAIHTNRYGYGTASDIAQADFIPNGGSFQPACLETENLLNATCSHAMALFYYAETVANNNCLATEYYTVLGVPVLTSSTAYMGYYWSGESGDYILTTNSVPNYCKG